MKQIEEEDKGDSESLELKQKKSRILKKCSTLAEDEEDQLTKDFAEHGADQDVYFNYTKYVQEPDCTMEFTNMRML